MKKALVLGLILLALSSFAYADGGATVGMGFGHTQFTIATGSSAAGSEVGQGWTSPALGWPNGIRQNLDLAWSNQYIGFNTTVYVGNPNNGGANTELGNPNINVQNLYGTVKLLPDMFTVYVGQFQGDGWDHFRHDSSHPIHDVNQNNVGRFNGFGVIADVMPKDTGIDLAAFVKVPYPDNQYTLAEDASNYAVAGSYTVPNLLKITAGTNTFSTFSGPAGSSKRNIFAAVDLLMIPNLTLWDEFYFAGFDQVPSITIWSDELAAQYVMDQLTIVLAAFLGGNSDGGAPNYAAATSYTAWAVDPEIYYNVGVATIGLYGSVSGSSLANTGITYYVEPYVLLNNFGVRVSFGYKGNSQSGSPSTWEIPVLFNWGF